MYHLECSVEGANQHNRKNNIEISGLPDVIEDDILESTVVSILNKIVDKPIDASIEVEACHRIGGKRGFKGTLIRFVNRKRSDEIKSNRSKMNQVNLETFNIPAHNKIYLNDNLSPYFKSIAYKCHSLKRRDLIIQSKIDKGLVKIKKGSLWITVHHETVLTNLFPDIDFDSL